MANLAPEEVVDGPLRVPAPFGLFSVVDFRNPPITAPGGHWFGGGVKWHSIEGDNDLGIIGPVATPQEDTEGLPKDFDDDSRAIDEAGTFTLYGQQVLTPIGYWNEGRAKERARTLLTALEERTVEKVLTGGLGALLIPNLTTADQGQGAFVSDLAGFIDLIADFEAFLAEQYGSRGVLHFSRRTASKMLGHALLEARGSGLYTKLGTPVVAGSGYPDDTAWATSALLGYQSDIIDSSGRSYDLLDKDTNDLYAIAERHYSLGFEALAVASATITAPA